MLFKLPRSFSASWLALLAGLSLFLLQLGPLVAQPDPVNASRGVALSIEGPIGPATTGYVEQGLDQASRDRADFILLRIDTPGGLDQAMRDIIKAVLASPIPVISYVTPAGARAASAGTYILYASHLAAMAPATNLGAATPVTMGGASPMPDRPSDKSAEAETGSEDTSATDNESAKRNKAVNDAVAYIRGLAERRGRNADWAEKAVRTGASLSANEALKLQVIDLVADSEVELLKAANGRTVESSIGEVQLNTAGATIKNVDPDWRHKLLAVITNPSVAYILMMIGIYGLILEGYSPGALVPGITGAICLLMALFAFQVLPINYAGLALIALGVGLMVAEAFAPSFGMLGIGGTVAFVAGSILLMDSDVPGYDIHMGLIAGIATASAALMFLIIWMFARSRREAVQTGREGLIGSIAEVLEADGRRGRVFIHGESWKATASHTLRPGGQVRVLRINGLTLEVEPLPPHSLTQE